MHLALETSTRQTSAALFQVDKGGSHSNLVGKSEAQITGAPGSANLLVQIRELLTAAGDVRSLTDLISSVSLSIGPGSFTGLRLGVTTAKTIAFTCQCLCWPVSTHRVLAFQVSSQLLESGVQQLATVIDAQRGQWFLQLHESTPLGWRALTESTIVDPQKTVDSWQSNTLITGTGLIRHQEKLRLPSHVTFTPKRFWTPLAETVGEIARSDQANGQGIDPFQLHPDYGRLSAAEEKLLSDQ